MAPENKMVKLDMTKDEFLAALNDMVIRGENYRYCYAKARQIEEKIR